MNKMVPTTEAERLARTRGRNLRAARQGPSFYDKTGKTFEQAFYLC